LPQVCHHFAGDSAQVHRHAAQLAAGYPAEFEDVVDENRHPLRGGPDALEVASALDIELRGAVLEHDAAEPVDAAQRRAQIMRHRIAKRLQLPVACREIGGAVRHALFEAGVELEYFLLGPLALGDVVQRDDQMPAPVYQDGLGADRHPYFLDLAVAHGGFF